MTIRQTRTDLVTVLAESDIDVYEEWPDQFNPPGIVVAAPLQGPYLTVGTSFGFEYILNIDVWLLTDYINPAASLTWIDNTIETVLKMTEDWDNPTVDSPEIYPLEGTKLFGSVIHLTKFINI